MNPQVMWPRLTTVGKTVIWSAVSGVSMGTGQGAGGAKQNGPIRQKDGA